ncbi:hypothetical protein AYI68_g2784, partial [Smittium mucronatum]
MQVMGVTNAVLGVIGDGLSQTVEIQRDSGGIGLPTVRRASSEFDLGRSAKFAAWGLLMGPVVFWWYRALNRAFPAGSSKTLFAA